MNQLKEGIVERAPETPTGKRLFYMPHKPIVRRDTTTTKVRMVFDAGMKPHPMANGVSDCMFTGPPLQPLLWNILIRARVAPRIALADVQKAFLQVGIKDDDAMLSDSCSISTIRRSTCDLQECRSGQRQAHSCSSNGSTPLESTTSRI